MRRKLKQKIKNYLTKNIPTMFYEINTSNFQEMFLAVLKIFFTTEFSKYCKGQFLKVRSVYFQKHRR